MENHVSYLGRCNVVIIIIHWRPLRIYILRLHTSLRCTATDAPLLRSPATTEHSFIINNIGRMDMYRRITPILYLYASRILYALYAIQTMHFRCYSCIS